MPEQQSLIFRSHFTASPIARAGYDLSAPNPHVSKRAGLYLIIHEGQSKLYVGSAVDLCRRHGEHQRMLRRGGHENEHLQKAWNRHGQGAFSFLILFYCAPSDLLFYEQRAIDFYKERIGWRQMYNSNPTAGSRLGRPKSAEERAKISARMMGNQYTKGRKLSPEHKARISAWTIAHHTGRKMSDETKAKIGSANRGRVVSAETRAKLSVAGKGRKLTAEHKANLARTRKAFTGCHHSPETKAILSAKSRESALRRQRCKEGRFS